MQEMILERLAKKMPRVRDDEEEKLQRKTRRALSIIKRFQNGQKKVKSGRGGLSSMGARGVFIKDADIYSRRVIVKSKFKRNNGDKFKERLRKHLDYITRDGAGDGGKKPDLFSESIETINHKNILERFSEAPHNFRFIVSPEDSEEVDLKEFTKDLIHNIEIDLGAKLDWVASIHKDTNAPHIHLVVNGKDRDGEILYIKRDYITHGIRNRASKEITKILGLRSWDEVVNSISFEVNKSKKCSLDKIIERNIKDGKINLNKLSEEALDDIPKALFSRRLAYLEDQGLSKSKGEKIWQINMDYASKLSEIERSCNIVENLSKILGANKENFTIQNAESLDGRPVEGRVLKRSRIDEFDDEEYLVVESKDGKRHYVELEKFSEKIAVKVGELVRVETTKPFSGPKISDRTIWSESNRNGGIYDASVHSKNAKGSINLPPGVSAKEYVEVHLKRLEVLARIGLVKKLSEDRFSIPKDYIAELALAAKKSKGEYKAHIKVIRLAPAVAINPAISKKLKPC
jgi:type IV secretory pathway VirD2 relaxase